MNFLNKLPKFAPSRAKAGLEEIRMTEGREDAEKAIDRFLAKHQINFDKAADCLAKDRDALLAFYDFPAEHSHDRSQCCFQAKSTGGIHRA